MRVYSVRKEVYIPDWNGNKDLPDDEKIMVEIRFPTGEERDSLNALASKENAWIKSWVERFVDRIDNLFDVVDGQEKPIKNGADLMKSTNRDLYSLASELCIAILNRSRLEHAEKKS